MRALKNYLFIGFSIFHCLTTTALGQLAAWDFNGNTGSEVSVNATTNSANLLTSTITRGAGLVAASKANSFNSNNFTISGIKSDAITNSDYLQITISPQTNYEVSLSTLDANFCRSSTGPNTFQWQYSLDGFSTIGIDFGAEISYTGTETNGLAQTQINLSNIPVLQNVNFGHTITLRLYGWGATGSSGSFSLGKLSGDDLSINGADQSLPVELSLWNGTSKNGQIVLNWTTDSEIENLGFIIERAQTEKGPWNEIASFSKNNALKGQGSTNNVTDYQYTDEAVEVGKTYYYRLSDVDYQGVRKTHAIISVVVSGKDQNALPGGFNLERIYPNPFNPSVTIDFSVAEQPAMITVNLFDLQGRLVNELTHSTYTAGNHQVQWNGLSQTGQPAPSGIYLMQISNDQSFLTRKVILAR